MDSDFGRNTRTFRLTTRIYQHIFKSIVDTISKISFEENLRLFDKWHNKDNGRIKILFGPQGPDFLSKELLLKIDNMKIKEI